MTHNTRPGHYGGEENPFEPIKIIEAMGWGEGFNKGNALKYLMRAGKKDDEVLDLKKAKQYLDFEIARLEKERSAETVPQSPEIEPIKTAVPTDVAGLFQSDADDESHVVEIHEETDPVDMSVQDIDAIAAQPINSLSPSVPEKFDEHTDEEAGVDVTGEIDPWSALSKPLKKDKPNDGPGTPDLTPPSLW